jgi:AraC-like DNA-binding protein
MARPELFIDWKKVDELMMAGCMGTEIAAYFAMHPNTFYRRVEEQYSISFSEYIQEKRSKGESLLRAHQYAKALGLTDKGDNTLLIWLGKTRLNQKEPETLKQVSHTILVNNDLAAGSNISAKAISEECNKSPK